MPFDQFEPMEPTHRSLLQVIDEDRISRHLAMKHVVAMKEHRARGIFLLWLHRSDPSVPAVPEFSPAARRLRFADWMQVTTGGERDPEEVLADKIRLCIRILPSEKIVSLTGQKNKMVGVYIRGDEAYVAPRAGPLAANWAVDPVLVVSVAELRLAKALSDMIATGPFEGDPAYPMSSMSTARDVVCKASGLRSGAEFERGLKTFHITIKASETGIRRWIPNPKERTGTTRDEGWSVTLRSPPQVELIAHAIIEALPTTPHRASSPTSHTRKSHHPAIHQRDLDRLFDSYIPECMKVGEANSFLFDEDERPNRFMEMLADFVDDLSLEIPEDRDKLKRTLELMERMCQDGDATVRDAVASEFIQTTVGMAIERRIAELCGPQTREILIAQEKSRMKD